MQRRHARATMRQTTEHHDHHHYHVLANASGSGMWNSMGCLWSNMFRIFADSESNMSYMCWIFVGSVASLSHLCRIGRIFPNLLHSCREFVESLSNTCRMCWIIVEPFSNVFRMCRIFVEHLANLCRAFVGYLSTRCRIGRFCFFRVCRIIVEYSSNRSYRHRLFVEANPGKKTTWDAKSWLSCFRNALL